MAGVPASRHAPATQADPADAAAYAMAARATCARLRAEALAEAALLYAPRFQIEGAHAPSVANPEDPTAPPVALQARIALALSPIDMLRGRAIEAVADAECVRTTLSSQLGRMVALGERHGELAAARAELAYLDSHIAEIDALVDDVLTRFEHRRATAREVDELRERRAAFRVRIAQLRHTIGILEQLDGAAEVPPNVDDLARSYRAAALEVEHRRTRVRGLSAWRFDVRAGIAGADRVDWFAVVELGYSLGQPWQRAADRRALRARAEELAIDPGDVSVSWDRFRRAMRRSVEALESELQILDDELSVLRRERDRIDRLAEASDGARQLRARYTIELIELDARRSSVASLAAARRPLAKDPP